MSNKVNSVFFSLFHTLGDVIVTTAIIRNLKEKYKDAKITYAVSEEYVEILRGNPDIAEIIPVKHPWEGILRSRDKQYDKVFLPLQLTHLDSVWHQLPPWCEDGENHNLVDMYAKKCQDDLVITDRRTFIYPNENAWKEIVQSAGDKAEDFEKTPFITVHTTSRNESKDWSYERFAELCTRINKEYNGKFNIYQIGRDDKQLPLPVKCLNGMPLSHTISLINKSKFHLDIDSGPSFIADSLNVPTVCIMGATTKNTSGPIGPNVTFIEPIRKCIGSPLHTACHSHCVISEKCIDTISVDEVFNVVNEKLKTIFG